MIQDLVTKSCELFLEHFARLGVFQKVLALAGPSPEEEERAKTRDDKVSRLAEVTSRLGGWVEGINEER